MSVVRKETFVKEETFSEEEEEDEESQISVSFNAENVPTNRVIGVIKNEAKPNIWVLKPSGTREAATAGNHAGRVLKGTDPAVDSPKILVYPVDSRSDAILQAPGEENVKSLYQKEANEKELTRILVLPQIKEEFTPKSANYDAVYAMPTSVETPLLRSDSSGSEGDRYSTSSCESSSTYSSNEEKRYLRKNRVKLSVLDESLRYRHIRDLNNQASKRLRERKKREKEQLLDQVSQLENENFRLKREMESLELAKNYLRCILLNRQ